MDMDVKKETTVKVCYHTGIVFGVLLILLGGLFLLANLGMLPNLKHVIISWQMLLVAVGILSFRKHPFTSFCLILVGGFFLIPRLAVVFPASFAWVGANFISNCWGILLIAAGIFWIIVPRKKWRRRYERNVRFHHHHRHHCHQEEKQYEINGDFSKTTIFGSGEYIVLDPEFKGGVIKTVFGASEIDLRKTSLPEGDTYLKMEAVFSGITFLIPDDWNIESQIEFAFSEIADKRRVIESVNPSRRLILVGSCVFSGCEIKN